MISETIKGIYCKGSDEIYLSDYPLIQTESGFYKIDLGGFDRVGHVERSEYHTLNMPGVYNLRILEVYANGHDMYIRLSDDQILSLVAGEGGLEFRLDDQSAYFELKEWFDSPEPRESELQKLSIEQPRWTAR